MAQKTQLSRHVALRPRTLRKQLSKEVRVSPTSGQACRRAQAPAQCHPAPALPCSAVGVDVWVRSLPDPHVMERLPYEVHSTIFRELCTADKRALRCTSSTFARLAAPDTFTAVHFRFCTSAPLASREEVDTFCAQSSSAYARRLRVSFCHCPTLTSEHGQPNRRVPGAHCQRKSLDGQGGLEPSGMLLGWFLRSIDELQIDHAQRLAHYGDYNDAEKLCVSSFLDALATETAPKSLVLLSGQDGNAADIALRFAPGIERLILFSNSGFWNPSTANGPGRTSAYDLLKRQAGTLKVYAEMAWDVWRADHAEMVYETLDHERLELLSLRSRTMRQVVSEMLTGRIFALGRYFLCQRGSSTIRFDEGQQRLLMSSFSEVGWEYDDQIWSALSLKA